MNSETIVRNEARRQDRDSAPPPDDSRVVDALEEYVQAMETGARPNRAAFLARHAEIAVPLAACLDGLDFVHVTGRELTPTSSGATVSSHNTGGAPLGDFRILREIGRGGMGVVYEAEQLSLGRRVALKVLPFASTLDAKQLQRFKNEAQAAAHLHHQNIVPVHATGCERGVHYYAMQLIDGHTLAEVIADLRQTDPPVKVPLGKYAHPAADVAASKSGPTAETPPNARLSTLPNVRGRAFFHAIAQLGVQAAEAIDYSHELGVIHRDIKPANMLVDNGGKLWITDFGLAHCQSQAGLTMSGDLVGTLRYMSPEQALAKRIIIDHRTDIYSLGATLYELLTLAPVFTGDDRQELLRQIAFEDPVAPRQIDKTIPLDLETVVLKALEKNPNDRYGSAKELADDLKRYVKNELTLARRPTLWQRGRKWAQRHVAAVRATVAALFVVALVVTGASVWLLREAERTAAEERKAKQVADERRQQAEATADLLASIFKNLNPRKNGGLDLKDRLIAELDTAADQLEGATTDSITQARLQDALGDAFRGLGEANKAVIQLQRAVEARQAKLGPDDPDTLSSTRKLARSYQDAGRPDLALPLLQETLKRLKGTLGPDHRQTLLTMHSLSSVYGDLGKLELAESLSKETLELRIAKLGPDDSDTLDSMSTLGALYTHNGKLDLALPLLKKGLEKSTKTRGPDHLNTLIVMENLAHAYELAGEFDLAVPLLEQTLAKKRVTPGPDHPITLAAMSNLAGAYVSSGKPNLALPLIKETAEKATIKHGRDHPRTLSYMVNLAIVLRRSGQPAKAIEGYRERLRLAPNDLTAETNIGNALLDMGQVDEAILAYEKVLRQNPSFKAARYGLGYAHGRKGQHKDAIAAYRQALRLNLDFRDIEVLTFAMKVQGQNGIDAFFLAMSYEQLGKKDEARACFDKGIEWLESRGAADVDLDGFRADAAVMLGVTNSEKKK